MKRIFACFLALLCLTVFCGSRVFAAGDVVDVARHGVAVVDVGVQVDDFWDEHGSGSGFFVGEKTSSPTTMWWPIFWKTAPAS